MLTFRTGSGGQCEERITMRAVPRTVASDAEFNQFRAELWDSLGASIPGEWRTFDVTSRELEIPCEPVSPAQQDHERLILQQETLRGTTNVNLSANAVFFDRHPERNGRLISREKDGSNFPKLSREWICIRDTLVLPFLRGTTPGPFSLRDALVTLKRAETLKRAKAGYRPVDAERLKIDSAITRLKAVTKYLVDQTTYRVTFVERAGTKVRITTIEDFVLFVEAVEAQYPAASAQQVVSEIRQLWFSDVHWVLLVASEGIIDRGVHINIESEPNPIAKRFDIAHLAPGFVSDSTRPCSLAGGKVFSTPMGQVNIGHVMAGIDARLSGFPASYPQYLKALDYYNPANKAKYDILKDFSDEDPTAFTTFAGDLGQAYAIFIFTRYKQGDRSAELKNFIAQCARPQELLGDIHGYIAAAVAADVRSSGASPTGTVVTASGIVRDMYLVDKSSSGTTYESYLEKVSGQQGHQLKNYISGTSMDFAQIWYVRLNFKEYGPWWEPGQLFDDYVREFSELADRHENSAPPADTLGGLVGELLVTARDRLK
ncbi:MAG: hypothetical protein ACRDS0_05545 [Pseudonocardiaceae bacterium]